MPFFSPINPVIDNTSMKKLFVYAAVVGCVVVSCSKPDEIEYWNQPSLVESLVRTSRLTLEDVEQMIGERRGLEKTRTKSQYQIEPILHGEDTVMYLVNYEEGWEVISGDLRADPVLFFCERGNIRPEELFSNPARASVMEGLSRYLDSLVINPIETESMAMTRAGETPPSSYIDENGRYWGFAYRYLVRTENETKNPLTGLKWGQGSSFSSSMFQWNVSMPYNTSTDMTHCVAGCGPVAVGQTLVYLHNYYGVPQKLYKTGSCSAHLSGSSSYVEANSLNTTFSDHGNYWSDLPVTSAGATASQLRAASTLLLDIGKESNTKYYSESSSSSFSGLMSALSYFDISCTHATRYLDLFRDQIYVKSLPVILGILGHRTIGATVEDLAHVVLAEGFKRNKEVYTYVYKNGDSGSFEYQYRQYTFTYNYIAINWGYDGDGEYVGDNVVWNSINSTLVRTFEGGNDTGTISEMLYDFNEQ